MARHGGFYLGALASKKNLPKESLQPTTRAHDILFTYISPIEFEFDHGIRLGHGIRFLVIVGHPAHRGYLGVGSEPGPAAACPKQALLQAGPATAENRICLY